MKYFPWSDKETQNEIAAFEELVKQRLLFS